MNSKSLLACLVILALVAFSAQGLMIKKSHKKQMHMVKQFASALQHKMFQAYHIQDDDTDFESDEGSDFIMELFFFVLGDEQIFNSLNNNQTLSQESADKIKQFMINSPGFNNLMLTVFNDPEAPECLTNLSEDQKRKLIIITIEQMDFTAILNESQNPENEAAVQDQIQQAIANDQDLGDDVAQCFIDNQESFSSFNE